MKLIFLRHTSLKVELDTFYGQTDLDVSGNFKKEVEDIKKKISSLNIDLKKFKVLSSPLKRCVKLTEQISNKYQTDDRIKEMNLGDWEMKKMSSIPTKQKNDWENNLLSFKIPNGESNEEFLNRLNDFLKDFLKMKQDIFVICHAGSINGMISILTGEPFHELVKNYWEKIGYGSLSIIEIRGGSVFKKRIGI